MGCDAVTSLSHAALLAPWPTPNAMEGGQTSRGGDRKDEKLMGGLVGWPTPMAGNPGTEEYNEAGNTDSSRKTVGLVAPWATPNVPNGGRTSNTTNYRKDGKKQQVDLGAQVQLASWATPTENDAESSGSRNTAGSKAHQGMSLTDQVMTGDSAGRVELHPWYTPHCPRENDSQHSTSSYIDRQILGTDSTSSSVATEKRGALNPAHSRWLMGYPVAWCQAAISVYRTLKRRRKGA